MNKLLLLFLTTSKIIFSQADSSKALVYFKEKGVIIYLNNKKIDAQKDLQTVPIGKYSVKAWAPHYDLMEDTFMVLKNQNKFYSKKLKFSEDYKTYRRRQHRFKLTYIIPVVISVVSGVCYHNAYTIRNKSIDLSYSKALDIQAEYENASTNSSLSEKSLKYNQEKANYLSLIQKQENIKTQGIIVTSSCLATALTLYIIDLVRKRKPFKETSLLTKMTPSYNPLSNQVCITIKL